MKRDLLQQIMDDKKTCYFVSPHFDDAVLSAGALASRLSGRTRIVVINVFTEAGPKPYTLSAKAYLRQCSYADAEQLYRDRVEEDSQALGHMADEVINLGFADALWRPRRNRLLQRFARLLPELGVVYPTYRFHIIKGNMARSDRATLEAIKTRLAALIDTNNSVVFCPLGVGKHIDHTMTRRACDELFADPVYWTDYPYSLDETNKTSVDGLASFRFTQGKTEKQSLIETYGSQFKALFPDELRLTPEQFYYRQR